MRSSVRILGHPLHAILTDFPIALWSGSLVADLVYLWQGTLFWYDMAWWLMMAGLISALATAAFGAIDYFRAVPAGSPARSTARTHGLLNLAIAVLYVFNLWWRWSADPVDGGGWWLAFALSLAGVAALGYAGWLGGELVYRHHIGVLIEPELESQTSPVEVASPSI